jgi:hypothetical protein
MLGVPSAKAVTFDFGVDPGNLGTTHPYTVGGFTVTAAGFLSPAALAAGTPNVALFGKQGAGDERGLGLVNDLSGENEISGTSLIRIAMAAGLTSPVTFQMNSTTLGETWQVSGSNSATTGFASLLTGTDELSHAIPFFNFYTFNAVTGNVLLANISAVPGPIVGAGLPGLVAACGGLLGLARRRRRKSA